MADEADRHLMRLVKLRLEGKQGEHQVAGIADLQYTLLPPRPYRRADIVHGANAGLTQLELDAQGEIRRIDANEHIGLALDQAGNQAAATRQQLGQPTQYFDQAHDRQALHGEIADQPLGLHARAAHADELDVWVLDLERLHQACTENVAGCLAGNQRDTQYLSHGSASNAAAGRQDRIAENRHFGELGSHFFQLDQRFFDGEALAIDDLVGTAQRLHRLGTEATTA